MQSPIRVTNTERREQGKWSHVHLGRGDRTSQRDSSMARDSLWVTVSPPSIEKCVALLNFSYFICIKVEGCYLNIGVTASGLQELDNYQLYRHIFLLRKFVAASFPVCVSPPVPG